jgi:type III protein arginine methyltransferase
MQAVYFPKKIITLNPNESFILKCNHDEYSLWFDFIKENGLKSSEVATKENGLGCNERSGLVNPTLTSRNRISQLNDQKRNDMFLEILKKVNNAYYV